MLCGLGSGYEIFYFVAAGTPEEAWVKKFLPQKQQLSYRLARGRTIENSSYTQIFGQSDLKRVIKANGIDAIFLTVNTEDAAYLKKIFRQLKVKLIGVDFNLSQKFENKIWFDNFCRRYQLPTPKSQIWRWQKKPLTLPGKIVLQEPESMGAEGTFFCQGENDIKRLVKAGRVKTSQDYLARQFVIGTPLGITVLIAQDQIALSAMRRQCYGADRVFLGIQWLPQKYFSPAELAAINAVFKKTAGALAGLGYRGLANIDFILGKGARPYIIECNPRLSLATNQVFKFPFLINQLNAGQLMVQSVYGKNQKSNFKFYPVPKTDYAGSVLEINIPPKTIASHQPLGLYNQKMKFLTADIRQLAAKNQFYFITFVSDGEKFKNPDTIGQVVSSLPLFDFNGRLNFAGKKILKKFKL